MNIELLRAIANASAANTVVYVGPTDGKPLHDQGYISIDSNNRDPNDTNKIAATITDAGVKYLAEHGEHQPSGRSTTTFQVMTGGIELPKIKRGGGGGGAPTKYPFDTMEVGSFFFVANSAVDKGDAVKTLSSAAGSANQRYSEIVRNPDGTAQTKTVTRAERGPGNKAVKDANGNVVKKTMVFEVKKQTRHFTVRPVKAGVQYGNFTAPADGAVVVREEVKAA